jgi:hypothetical protein
MSNARKLRVVDMNTGEDMSADYTLRHRNQDEAFRWKKDGDGRHFTWSNMENLHEVYGALTTAQCGYLMLLQCYVGFEGGTLVVAKDGPPMEKRDMMEKLQLEKKRQTFYDFYKACTEHGIIIEQVDGTYAINERYHFKGRFNDQFLVKAYSAKLKRVYKEVKATDIGLIYRMLPFVHMETNALCINPLERNPRKIDWFNRKELAEAIGVNPDTLGRRLPKMKFDGEYVVARIKVGTEPERYTFNPSVFYRQNKKPDKTLQSMFNIKDE